VTSIISISMFGTADISLSGTYAIEGSLATVNIEGPGVSGNPISTEILGFSGDVITTDISNGASVYLNPISGGVVSDSFNVGQDANNNNIGHGTLEFSSQLSSMIPPIVNLYGVDNEIILDPGVSNFTLGDSPIGTGSSFVGSDTIDMQGVVATSASFTQNSFFGSTSPGGTLVLDNSAGQVVGEVFLSVGTYASNGFSIETVNGGTEITVCFAAGTRILTPEGEKEIDHLKVGDMVVAQGGRLAPIRWIGHRHIDNTKHPRPETVLPVQFEPDAIKDGVPARHLFVSPDHALFIDGHLIPAKALINGYSIRQVARKSVDYYHLELDRHDVIYAEETAVESYLDTGNRHFFDGSKQVVLHPDFGQRLREATGCAPFAEQGPVVESVREDLIARAGIPVTNDPDLNIESLRNGSIIIRSRVAVPGHLTPDPRDRRILGVKIAALKYSDGSSIPLDHPALVDGWYEQENDGRWTNGCAVIPAILAEKGTIRVDLGATLNYPKDVSLRSHSERMRV